MLRRDDSFAVDRNRDRGLGFAVLMGDPMHIIGNCRSRGQEGHDQRREEGIERFHIRTFVCVLGEVGDPACAKV